MKAILGRAGTAAAAAALLLAAAGCSPTVSNHGYRPNAEVVAQIKPGVTSKEEVQRLLGSPSSLSTFSDQSWYYVTQRTEQLTFYQEKVAAQDVLRIDFDANGLVADVNKRGLDVARNVVPASETTKTGGNELTLLQQFVGNIGRFNNGQETGSSQAGSVARPRVPGG
jgi:outer membrane protein assembly factor BamE (lipoprotein component of BamABCDE complex)